MDFSDAIDALRAMCGRSVTVGFGCRVDPGSYVLTGTADGNFIEDDQTEFLDVIAEEPELTRTFLVADESGARKATLWIRQNGFEGAQEDPTFSPGDDTLVLDIGQAVVIVTADAR